MKKADLCEYAENYNELLRRGTEFFSSDYVYFAKYKVLFARCFAL